MPYTKEDYILFFLALALFLVGLALLDMILKLMDRRAEKRREQLLRNLNRREEWHRRHKAYTAQMKEVLESIGRRSS